VNEPDRSTAAAELKGLGFTTLEAEVYAGLAMSGRPMSGYELAKELGASRSNVYAALHRLERAGAVLQQPHHTGNRYWAVEFSAVAERALGDLRARIARLSAWLAPGLPPGGVWMGQGIDAFAQEASLLVREAVDRVEIGAAPLPVARLMDALEARGPVSVARRFTCWAGCPSGGCGRCEDPLTGAAVVPALAGACCVVADGRRAVVTLADPEAATVLLTDFAPVVEGLRALMRPGVSAAAAPS
jgi:predicted transcriptional regulator